MSRVVMADGWEDQVRTHVAEMFDTRLGPAIAADAKMLAPVDTGRLEASIEHQVIDDGAQIELQVGAFPDDEGDIAYAAAVEMGFHGFEVVEEYVNHNFMGRGKPVLIREHGRHANTPEQPYLRPALYMERGE